MKKLKHICYFPNCEYETESRSKIDHHHIIPREIDKSSKVTLPLCKTHHALIYVPNAKSGQHSIKTTDSIIILGKYKSTQGYGIHYETEKGTRFYWFPDSKETWND